MREFIRTLRERGEILEIHREVDPAYELAAVSLAAEKRMGLPVLFHKVRGTQLPVATGIFGGRERLSRMVGTVPGDLARRWAELIADASPLSYPTSVEVPGNADDMVECRLSDLPLISYSEHDAGPYFTAGVFLARHPHTGVPNLSFHRAMYVGDGELRCRLGPSHDLAHYHAAAEKSGRPLEAAILLGPPPSLFVAGVMTLPPDGDEMEMAARIQQAPVEMRRCRHVDLLVPASTEIVIEGRFLPGERRPEGPFGEWMGYYTEETPNAVFEVLGVTRRRDAIFHSILCGSPEELTGEETAREGAVLSVLSASIKGIKAVACHLGAFYTVVQMATAYEGHSRQALLAAMASVPRVGKYTIVVDEDVDPTKMDDVLWAMATRADPQHDFIVVPDIPSVSRDPKRDHWSRVGIDATRPTGREHELRRKRIPGEAGIDLRDYLRPPGSS